MRFNLVMHALEAAGGFFFFDEERRVVFASGIIHGVNQVPCLPSDPFVGVSILMDYRAWQGGLSSPLALAVSRSILLELLRLLFVRISCSTCGGFILPS